MIRPFVHQALPMRVLFGVGSLAELPDEIEALGLRRVLVLSSPSQEETARLVTAALGEQSVGIFAEARTHVPADLACRARDRVLEWGADCCLAVGGGSAIGLAKAIALEHELPVIAVPTTYAGSEMTPVWGLTEAGEKQTGRDERVLPRSVVYDPELTLPLPPQLSLSSGMNAIAHAVEGLYAPDVTPIVSLMAEEGVRAMAAALPGVVADGRDLEARALAQYGAWLCGAVLGATTMSLHHKLCHVLGGTLDLPHASTHAVVLPHVLAFNAPAAADAVAALSRALDGGPDPAAALWDLTVSLGGPRSLHELGMHEKDLPRIAELAGARPYANPRPVTRVDIEALLMAAWTGTSPPPSAAAA